MKSGHHTLRSQTRRGLLLTAALLASCGTQRDIEEIAAAAAPQVVGAGGTATGAASVGGSSGTGTPGTTAGGAATAGAGSVSSAASTGGGTTADSPSGDGAGSAGGSQATNRSEILIGSVGTLSGIAGESLASAVQALQVWANSINARGGLDGHPVRIVTGDDGGDAARHVSLLNQLRDQGVVVFVQKQEPFAGPAVNGWHRDNQIPVIGTEGGSNYVYDNEYYFPTASSGDRLSLTAIAGPALTLIPQGQVRLGSLTCTEADACATFHRVWASSDAAALGYEPVYRARSSLTQPDYTAECLAARNAGVQVLALGLDPNSAGRVAASCHRQGFSPTFVVASNIATPGLRQNPELEGALIGVQTFAFPATDNPARQEFHDAFAQYAPGAEISGGSAVGWVSAKVLELAGQDLPDTVTPQDIMNGLWQIQGNDLGGLTGPITYTQGAPATPFTCFSLASLAGQQYEAPLGGNLTCL